MNWIETEKENKKVWYADGGFARFNILEDENEDTRTYTVFLGLRTDVGKENFYYDFRPISFFKELSNAQKVCELINNG